MTSLLIDIFDAVMGVLSLGLGVVLIILSCALAVYLILRPMPTFLTYPVLLLIMFLGAFMVGKDFGYRDAEAVYQRKVELERNQNTERLLDLSKRLAERDDQYTQVRLQLADVQKDNEKQLERELTTMFTLPELKEDPNETPAQKATKSLSCVGARIPDGVVRSLQITTGK